MFISLKPTTKVLTIVASLLCIGGIVSYVKTDENTKPLALNIAIAGAAIAISNHLVTGNHETVANNQLKDIVEKFESEIKSLTKNCETLSQNSHKQNSVLAEIKKLSDTQALELAGKEKAIKLLQGQLSQITSDFEVKKREIDQKLLIDDNRFSQLLVEFKGQLVEDLSDRIYRIYNSLIESSQHKLASEDYQKIHAQLENFTGILKHTYQRHCNLLENIREIEDTPSEIVTQSIDIYSKVNDDIAALKVRYRNILNIDERQSLEDAYSTLADFKEGTVPKANVKIHLQEYSDFQKNQLESFKSKVDDNQNSLNEMREQVTDLLDELDVRSLKINELNQKIIDLQQPLRWTLAQGSNPLTKGNIIINYFWGKGIKLDRGFIAGDEYESKIYFHTDNNARTLVFKELNEHSEALQQLCLTHKPVTFDWDADKGLMIASLVWKVKTKEQQTDELSDESVNRLARSWDTWKKQAKKWNRIRITGGSGAGKSPLTERIVSEQLRHKKVKGLDAIKLYNPQAGSRKDNWSFPSVGKTHADSIRGVGELTKLCSRKFLGEFAVWIFDEVDSSLRQAPGKKRPTADEPEPEPTMAANMLSIITQIDHTSQAVFYLGQGANTGKIPNTTKGDWNNLVAIHINGNAKDYLRLADHIDSESKDKLMKQADLLQRYCDRKNSDLGLDRVEPGAYRYALVDEYGEKQYYVLLPLFSADEFLDSLSTNTQNEILANNLDNELEPTKNTLLEVNINCPHCGYSEHRSQGDRWKCKNITCGKTWVK